MRDFVSQTLSIIDFISSTIKTIIKNVYVRSVSERVLLILDIRLILLVLFTKNGVKNLPPGIGNIFFNNEQKYTNDTVRKKQVVDVGTM